MSYWATMARRHWQQHLPERYAALADPERYFQLLDEHASSYYRSIRDGLLEGVNPNNGTIGWDEFLIWVHQADRTAHEIVSHELVYLPPEDSDEDDEPNEGAGWSTRDGWNDWEGDDEPDS